MAYDPNPAATHDPATGVVVPVNWLDLLNSNFAELGSAWTTYGSAWLSGGTQPVLGDGSLLSAVKIIGKTCYFRQHLVAGSTTTFGTGDYYWPLPGVQAVAGLEQVFPGKLVDNSSGTCYSVVGYTLGGGFTFHATFDGGGNVGAAAPFAWADGDHITFNAVIEIQ